MRSHPMIAVLLGASLASPLAAQEAKPADCPLHAAHASQDHHAGVDQRGDQVMGFDHTRTTHRFLLKADGGDIEVRANDPADGASRDQIRGHLAQVAEAFARGDFAMPGMIHDRQLPGVPEMTRLKEAISYRYEETEQGGRLRITTKSPEALSAIHAFLRAQIEDHRTGDSHQPSS